MSARKRWSLAAVGLVLLAALASLFVGRWRGKPQQRDRPRMTAVVPKDLPGWVVSDEPLGQTEVVNHAVLKALNLDDYVYRRFERSGKSFTVYVAYWAPGRMPVRLVASHTPDRCWTENGMRCVEMDFRRRYTVGEKHVLPAEYRVFVPEVTVRSAEQIFVAYWHIIDGKEYDYGSRFNAVPHPLLWWKDAVAQTAHGSREQFFVRIASVTPLEELWLDRDFQCVILSLDAIGIFQAAQ